MTVLAELTLVTHFTFVRVELKLNKNEFDRTQRRVPNEAVNVVSAFL